MMLSKKSAALILLSLFATVACAPKKSSPASETAAAEAPAPAAPGVTTVQMLDTIGNRADFMLGLYKGTMLKERKECLVHIEKYTYTSKLATGATEIRTALSAEVAVPSDGRRGLNVFQDTSDSVLNSPKIVLGSGGVDSLGQNPFALILRNYDQTELQFFGKKLTSAHTKAGSVQFLVANTTNTEIHCMDLVKQ